MKYFIRLSVLFLFFGTALNAFGQDSVRYEHDLETSGWGRTNSTTFGYFESIIPVSNASNNTFLIKFRPMECKETTVDSVACSFYFNQSKVSYSRKFNAYECRQRDGVVLDYDVSVEVDDNYDSFKEALLDFYVSETTIDDKVVASSYTKVTARECITIVE